MKHGWTSVFRDLFFKKQPRETASTNTTHQVEAQNNEQDGHRAPTPGKGPGNKNSDKKAPKGDAFPRTSKSGANNPKITSPAIGVFHISGNLRNHHRSNTCQELLPLFHHRVVSYVRSPKDCKNADDVIVIDL